MQDCDKIDELSKLVEQLKRDSNQAWLSSIEIILKIEHIIERKKLQLEKDKKNV